jgi:DNA-binding MarR family transcriptional regulator
MRSTSHKNASGDLIQKKTPDCPERRHPVTVTDRGQNLVKKIRASRRRLLAALWRGMPGRTAA